MGGNTISSCQLILLPKILPFTSIILSYIQKTDITWRIFYNNTLEVFMEEHFAHPRFPDRCNPEYNKYSVNMSLIGR